MYKSKQVWLWGGAAIIVLVVVIALLVSGPKPPPKGTPVFAGQGQLVSGFPAGLALDAPSQVGSSYSINYSSNTNQYTAQWTAAQSMSDIISAYENYFKTNGWTIAKETTGKYSRTSGIVASNNSGTALVSIVDNNSSRAVTVTYDTN